MKAIYFISILMILTYCLLTCSGNISLITTETINRRRLTEEDLRKIIYYTDGQIIFVRFRDSINTSQRRAANAVMGEKISTGDINERIALDSNSAGFFHHKTESHIFVQFMAGELVLPFRLDSGELDVPEIRYDGKKWEYEQGSARLMGRIKL